MPRAGHTEGMDGSSLAKDHDDEGPTAIEGDCIRRLSSLTSGGSVSGSVQDKQDASSRGAAGLDDEGSLGPSAGDSLTGHHDDASDVHAPDDTPRRFTYVAIGGGVAAGYWAHALVAELGARCVRQPFIAIVTTYPKGVYPYERPALSKAMLDPDAVDARRVGSEAFPLTMKGTGGEVLDQQWYDHNGVTFLWQSDVVEVNFRGKVLTVEQRRGRVIRVEYHQLVIATGSTPRTPEGLPIDPRWSHTHADMRVGRDGNIVISALEAYGFGSVHFVRDVGCIAALLKALKVKEEVGQVPCRSPVVLVGGGYLSMELAAGIATHMPHLKVLLVMCTPHLLHDRLTPELADFYERRLAAKGVMFARNMEYTSLWPVQEAGLFPTLSGDPFDLQVTEPRPFRPIGPQYSSCRGVILRSSAGELVRVPARLLAFNLGSMPNTSLFTNKLELSPHGHIVTDIHLRTSDPSGDVYAVGDCCCFPLALNNDAMTKLQHVQHARESAAYVGRCMAACASAATGGPDDSSSSSSSVVRFEQGPAYDPVPHYYSRFFDLSWKFYGLRMGQVVHLGMDRYEETKAMLAVWVHDGRVVGLFLEGGTQAQQQAMPHIVRERPRVLNLAVLAKLGVDEFFEDPHRFEPPLLGPGEFVAEIDDDTITTVLRRYAGYKLRTLRTVDLKGVMEGLGADWTNAESLQVQRALDREDCGQVTHDAFVRWWKGEWVDGRKRSPQAEAGSTPGA